MTLPTTLYLVRHGITVWNEEKRMQGQEDSPLSEQGVRQAEALASRMRDFKIDVIYASPSGRAYDTARIVRGDRGNKIIKRDDLKEIALGSWEGRKLSEIKKSEPERHHSFWEKPHLYEARGGETFFDLKKRAIPFVEEVTAKHPSEKILIVSHTTIIKTILSRFDGRTIENFWIKPIISPASLSIVEMRGGKGEIKGYGDISHYDKSAGGSDYEGKY